MKTIKYQLCTEVNHGTEEQPNTEQVFSEVSNGWSEANEKIAKAEAYNGEYEIIDDGKPEPVIPPTNAELASSLASVQNASAITFVALCEIGTLDVVTASEHAELFAPWAYPVAYTVGQLRRHNGKLYRCVQPHTSQADWTPDTEPVERGGRPGRGVARVVAARRRARRLRQGRKGEPQWQVLDEQR